VGDWRAGESRRTEGGSEQRWLAIAWAGFSRVRHTDGRSLPRDSCESNEFLLAQNSLDGRSDGLVELVEVGGTRVDFDAGEEVPLFAEA